jgi:signal transduction histidine kinase
VSHWRAVGSAVLATAVQSAVVTTGAGVQRATGAGAGGAASSLGLVQGLLVLALASVRGRAPRQGRRAVLLDPAVLGVAVCTVYTVQAALAGVILPAAPWVALVLLGTTAAWRATALGLAVLAAGFLAGSLARPASAGVVPLLATVTAVVILATALHVTRTARASAVAAQQEEARRRQDAQERLHLARELHDSIGHGLSVVAVQASAARMALQAGDRVVAARSLSAVEAAGRGTLADLRHLVHMLRDPQPHRELVNAPADCRSLGGDPADLAALVVPLRDAGVTVDLQVVGDHLDELSAPLRATVHRIVQEGLTNVVRHAPGATIIVRVERIGDDVVVEIANGPSGAGEPSGAHGLTGLRERAALLGGSVQAGPSGHGWRLTARLPAGGAAMPRPAAEAGR